MLKALYQLLGFLLAKSFSTSTYLTTAISKKARDQGLSYFSGFNAQNIIFLTRSLLSIVTFSGLGSKFELRTRWTSRFLNYRSIIFTDQSHLILYRNRRGLQKTKIIFAIISISESILPITQRYIRPFSDYNTANIESYEIRCIYIYSLIRAQSHVRLRSDIALKALLSAIKYYAPTVAKSLLKIYPPRYSRHLSCPLVRYYNQRRKRRRVMLVFSYDYKSSTSL